MTGGVFRDRSDVEHDQVTALELSDTTVIQMLKDYTESGSFARGKEEMPVEASVVLIGKTSRRHRSSFERV